MKSEICIIVPIFNAMPYLVECVKSIQNQTFRDWELILIDDGSSDESGVYCDMISLQDSRIKVYHQENKGIVFDIIIKKEEEVSDILYSDNYQVVVLA